MKTVQEFLLEKANPKIEKILDKVMSGKDGEKLATALDKNDEDKAIKILKANKVKPNDIDDVLELMFGSL